MDQKPQQPMPSAVETTAREQAENTGFFRDSLAQAHQLGGDTEPRIMALALAHMLITTPVALRTFAELE